MQEQYGTRIQCTARFCWCTFVALVAMIAMQLTGTPGVYAGKVRYDLPQLLGEYRYSVDMDNRVRADIDTPFAVSGVSSVIVVIEGTITHGTARGDGLLFEATQFDLDSSIGMTVMFPSSGFVTFPLPLSDSFRIHESFDGPFYSVTPLPGPGVSTPPFSFSVSAEIGPAFTTMYPNRVDPDSGPISLPSGFVVETPIVANIAAAYVVLEGASVVPEAGSCSLLLVGLFTMLQTIRRRYSE